MGKGRIYSCFCYFFVSFLLFSMSDLLGTNTIKMHSNIRLLRKYLNTVSSYLLTDLHEQFESGSGLQPLLWVALAWTAIFSNTTVGTEAATSCLPHGGTGGGCCKWCDPALLLAFDSCSSLWDGSLFSWSWHVPVSVQTWWNQKALSWRLQQLPGFSLPS